MGKDKLLKLTEEKEQRALAIFSSSIVIDCLNYSPTFPNFGHPEYLDEYKNAGVTATNFTIQVPSGDLHDFLRQVSLWHKVAEETDCCVAKSAKDILESKEKKRKCIILGLQNAKPLGEDIEFVSVFRKLGIRIIQLAYDEQNLFGAGGDEKDAGVTRLGRKMIEEMNRVGILIDVSHCGPQTTMDAIDYSAKPIAFTHTNAKALCDHYRNKTDGQLKALAARGGVVGITAYTPISKIRKDRRPNLVDFLDFVDYVVNLIGVEHVGFGLDLTCIDRWDRESILLWYQKHPGIATDNIDELMIEGLGQPSEIINIARGLVSRGYKDAEIRGILGENFLHLFKEVWL